MPKLPTFNFAAEDVWAAAVVAQRVIQSYIKAPSETQTKSNRELMIELLTKDSHLITAKDRKQAEDLRRYFQALTFKLLQDKTLGQYQTAAMTVASRDVITSGPEIGLIASLPNYYKHALDRDNRQAQIDSAEGFIGQPKDKVELTVTVIKENFSQAYGCYYISCLTDENQAVFFAFKETVGLDKRIKISGTVKSHRGNSTQLNRVKILEGVSK